MKWHQVSEQLSLESASSLTTTSADVVASIAILAFVGAVLLMYNLTFDKVDAPRYGRLESAGGGLLLGQGFMRAGYWALLPFGKAIARKGVPPNWITASGLISSCVAATAILYGNLGLAGLALFLGTLCDALDGMVARLGQGESESGAFFDAMVDRCGEVIVFAALAIAGRHSALMVTTCLSALLASLMNSYVSAKAEGYRVNIPNGRMRRGERSAWTSIGCLLVPLARSVVLPSHETHAAIPLIACVSVVALGTAISTVRRACALYWILNDRVPKQSRTRGAFNRWFFERGTPYNGTAGDVAQATTSRAVQRP